MIDILYPAKSILSDQEQDLRHIGKGKTDTHTNNQMIHVGA